MNINSDRVSRHKIIQKLARYRVPVREKIKLIDEIVHLLLKSFSGNQELISESILKDKTLATHTEHIFQIANDINHDTVELSVLRARVFNVFACRTKDVDELAEMAPQIKNEFQEAIQLPQQDEALYYSNINYIRSLFLF